MKYSILGEGVGYINFFFKKEIFRYIYFMTI
jgi:hypothetical protein